MSNHTAPTILRSTPMTVAELPTLCTLAEAQSVLRTSRSTVRRLIATGRLATAKLSAHGGSSRILIPRRSIERLIAELEGVQV